MGINHQNTQFLSTRLGWCSSKVRESTEASHSNATLSLFAGLLGIDDSPICRSPHSSSTVITYFLYSCCLLLSSKYVGFKNRFLIKLPEIFLHSFGSIEPLSNLARVNNCIAWEMPTLRQRISLLCSQFIIFNTDFVVKLSHSMNEARQVP